ncbi:hypothetical protein H5410_050026 [Solanum commersonii]|uniref:Uncharacterized protein n=1 Tax=Solanum commersonii TaxID=4109 RepID=A0A9J5WVP3_SOLCO|nr:hypothetical protein H5410_050026 [Solanum commersonii]
MTSNSTGTSMKPPPPNSDSSKQFDQEKSQLKPAISKSGAEPEKVPIPKVRTPMKTRSKNNDRTRFQHGVGCVMLLLMTINSQMAFHVAEITKGIMIIRLFMSLSWRSRSKRAVGVKDSGMNLLDPATNF